MQIQNPLGLNGIEFIEFASPSPSSLHDLFVKFGFSKQAKHYKKDLTHYQQNQIHFLLNNEATGLAKNFSQEHGPCISAMAWRVKNTTYAIQEAHRRGAEICVQSDYQDRQGHPIQAIYGIGRSLIYFIEDSQQEDLYQQLGFTDKSNQHLVADKGFLAIDHLTNNVPQGELHKWANFYKKIFGFTEVRYFDIKGAKTGLQSFALKSPCGKFCIPINEGTEEKSQINEYLKEYKGPGIQHLAFLTNDIIRSIKSLQTTGISTLDIEDNYYDEVFDRVPNVTEDHAALKKLDILVDGDQDGYLLQIFTKNIFGPIFIEIIQRKNHLSFGEGNFGALFRSIERDQEKRGVL